MSEARTLIFVAVTVVVLGGAALSLSVFARSAFLRRNRRWIIVAALIWFSLPFIGFAGLWVLGEIGGGMSR